MRVSWGVRDRRKGHIVYAGEGKGIEQKEQWERNKERVRCAKDGHGEEDRRKRRQV